MPVDNTWMVLNAGAGTTSSMEYISWFVDKFNKWHGLDLHQTNERMQKMEFGIDDFNISNNSWK